MNILFLSFRGDGALHFIVRLAEHSRKTISKNR